MNTGRYHHIFDLSNCNEHITDTEKMDLFMRTLADAIDMNILHGPVVEEGIEENPGLTAFAIVDFSHISIHTFSNNGEALVDVFSCKPYDKEKAEEICKKFFATPDTEVRHKEVYWG